MFSYSVLNGGVTLPQQPRYSVVYVRLTAPLRATTDCAKARRVIRAGVKFAMHHFRVCIDVNYFLLIET